MALSSELKVLTPSDGSLAELREERHPPPKPRKNLKFRIAPIFVDLYKEEIRPNCWREAYLALNEGEYITRSGSFITVLDIEWIRCRNEDEIIFIIDGMQLSLPHLTPITQYSEDLRVLAIAAIDFGFDPKWNTSEEIFRTSNQYAWEPKRYSLLNCTFYVGKNTEASGHLIGYSRNPLTSYVIVEDHVYGLTESSVASQTITDFLKIIPNYWILKMIFSLFDQDFETQLKTAFDWIGDFAKNLYFFATRGVLLFLAMYYIVRMFLGDGWVGIITSLFIANLVRLQGYYD